MKRPSIPNPALAFPSLIKLWPWLRPHKRMVIGGALLIPVVALISMYQPLMMQRAIDNGIMKGNLQETLFWATCGLGLSLGNYLFSAIQSLSTATAVHRMIRDLRIALVKHVAGLAPSWHDHQMSGALTTRATSDFDTLSESLNQGVLSSVIDVMVLIGCITGMFLLSPVLAVTALVILPIITWIVIWFSGKLNESMLASRKHLAALNGYTHEALTGVQTIKLLGAESSVSKHFATMNRKYREAQLENVYYDALMFSTIDGISSITLGVILFIAIRATGLAGDLTAGVMVAFVQYVQQLFDPLKLLGTKMAMLQGAFTSIERIFGLLERKETIEGSRSVIFDRPADIRFDHVTFRYREDSDATLNDVSFAVPASTSMAIVGRTGSGKTSIVRLLTKLYSGYQGEITIGGQSISEISPESLRSHIGMVPQDIVLFEGSIEFNIGLGRPAATAEEVRRVVKMVGADRFIDGLAEGLQFSLRENGTNLSHGQRQLIVFARALIGNPPILILDEATSSIDPQSEELIQRATANLLAERTVLVIAHRLSTIRQCRRVLEVRDGRVREQGQDPFTPPESPK